MGETATAVRTVRLLLHEAARRRMTGDKEATMLAVNQARAYSAEVGVLVTERALRLAGGRGILKAHPGVPVGRYCTISSQSSSNVHPLLMASSTRLGFFA